MPTRKIADLSGSHCGDREHDPPSYRVLNNGIYEHTCPRCGWVQKFIVNKPLLLHKNSGD